VPTARRSGFFLTDDRGLTNGLRFVSPLALGAPALRPGRPEVIWPGLCSNGRFGVFTKKHPVINGQQWPAQPCRVV